MIATGLLLGLSLRQFTSLLSHNYDEYNVTDRPIYISLMRESMGHNQYERPIPVYKREHSRLVNGLHII
jgi:hypothetical protein